MGLQSRCISSAFGGPLSKLTDPLSSNSCYLCLQSLGKGDLSNIEQRTEWIWEPRGNPIIKKKKKIEWLTFPLELQLLLGAANPNAPTTVFFTLMNTEAFTAKGWMGGAKCFSEFL